MIRDRFPRLALLAALGLFLAVGAQAQSSEKAPRAAKAAKSAGEGAASAVEPKLEPKALEILKAASDRLAAARSMTFTAVVSYESPSRVGPPLVYTTKSEVTLQRPDKLRIITLADGPPSEFYYDGKTMVAFAPTENLVAAAPAPPTIDGALEAAFKDAAIYFPFTDLIVSDPYQEISQGLIHAFYMGQSRVVGGTTTDIVAYANDYVFVQAWIGAEDKLPRRLRATFRDDPSRLRHQLDLSDWQLDIPVQDGAFASTNAAAATPMPFARPDPKPPAEAMPPAKGKPSKSQ
jgi:hypothetical protein